MSDKPYEWTLRGEQVGKIFADREALETYLKLHPGEIGVVHSVINPVGLEFPPSKPYPELMAEGAFARQVTFGLCLLDPQPLKKVREDLLSLIAQHAGGYKLYNCPACGSAHVHMQTRTELNNGNWVNQWICMECHWSKEFYDDGEIHEEYHKYD